MPFPTDETKAVRIDIRFSPTQIERIDEWRATQRPIPARAEAIRLLIDLGIDAGHGKKID